MKFYIEDVLVIFPYPYIYPEQLEYMTELKRGLDKGGHILLEMPSGTGKTISLLALLVAYIRHNAAERRRVVYCTRTVEEMTKTMNELRRLVASWSEHGENLGDVRGLCLSARKNMCIEPTTASLHLPQEVDAACRSLVAPWAREKCTYFENLETSSLVLPPGVYSLDEIKSFGETNHVCPYFLARKAIAIANIIVHSYLYMVDPSISGAVREFLDEATIVVMDKGHNVDDVCIEAMSLLLTKKDATEAREENMRDLSKAVEDMKATNRQQLQEEYDKLVNGLALARLAPATALATDTRRAPQFSAEMMEEVLPGSLRQAGGFIASLQRLTDFVYRIVGRITKPFVIDPVTFLAKVKEECAIDVRHLRFVSERLRLLLNTLQVSQVHRFRHVQLIAQMFTTLATYATDGQHEKPGFAIVCEPYDTTRPNIPDPVLRLVCLDASLAVRDVFHGFRSVVLTSGTLSPMEIYPKILGFTPVVSKQLRMTLSRRCIAPVIVTRSSDQTTLTSEELSSSMKVRRQAAAQEGVTKAYGNLLLELANTVPDGIVCFFTGYQYMGEVMLQWHADGTLQELEQRKLIFVETQGVYETSVALANYRKACDSGRGAIFMSIARGKIAEGIDFDRHYGRAVVMFGVPFLPPTDEPLRQRMQWMEQCLAIPENEYRNFDAIRQAAQCIGRVLRNKTDYGMMILVDKRYAEKTRRTFPNWIAQCFRENTNLSVDAAVAVARTFFREMAQPWNQEEDLGTSLFDTETMRRQGHLAPTAPRFVRQVAPPPIVLADVGTVVEDGGESVRAARENVVRKRTRE